MHYSKNHSTTICGLPCTDENGRTVNSWTNYRAGADCAECLRLTANLANVGQAEQTPVDKLETTATCKHPPAQIYSWFAHDDSLCIGCTACGTILKGAASC